MEPKFWIDRWQRQEIGFHRDETHENLQRFWSQLNPPQGSTVYVPLCGMSNDMAWIAGNGHKVIGVELSEIAIKAFFDAQQLTPETQTSGEFTIWSSGPFEIWAGDIFKLPVHAINDCAAVYDRAALVALPTAMQNDYVARLAKHLAPRTQILLISLAFDQSEMEGPPFSIPNARIDALFADSFKIQVLESENALEANQNLKKRGLTDLEETCYLLTRR